MNGDYFSKSNGICAWKHFAEMRTTSDINQQKLNSLPRTLSILIFIYFEDTFVAFMDVDVVDYIVLHPERYHKQVLLRKLI